MDTRHVKTRPKMLPTLITLENGAVTQLRLT